MDVYGDDNIKIGQTDTFPQELSPYITIGRTISQIDCGKLSSKEIKMSRFSVKIQKPVYGLRAHFFTKSSLAAKTNPTRNPRFKSFTPQYCSKFII